MEKHFSSFFSGFLFKVFPTFSPKKNVEILCLCSLRVMSKSLKKSWNATKGSWEMKWTYRHSIHNITDNFWSSHESRARGKIWFSLDFPYFCVSKQIIHSELVYIRKKIYMWKEHFFLCVIFNSLSSIFIQFHSKKKALKIKDKFYVEWEQAKVHCMMERDLTKCFIKNSLKLAHESEEKVEKISVVFIPH